MLQANFVAGLSQHDRLQFRVQRLKDALDEFQNRYLAFVGKVEGVSRKFRARR